jgi:hypothetical protein
VQHDIHLPPIVDSISTEINQIQPIKSSNTQYEIHWNGKVSVLNSKKYIDDNGLFYKRYEESCGSWNLKNDEIVSILSESKRINGIDYHNDFDILPCQMEGLGLTEDSTTFQYRINAGSGIVILMKDTFFYLGYYGTKKYFILGADSSSATPH